MVGYGRHDDRLSERGWSSGFGSAQQVGVRTFRRPLVVAEPWLAEEAAEGLLRLP